MVETRPMLGARLEATLLPAGVAVTDIQDQPIKKLDNGRFWRVELQLLAYLDGLGRWRQRGRTEGPKGMIVCFFL